MKALQGLSSTITSLTNVVIGLLGLVAENIIALVQGLGDAGIVGLVAAIIILNLYK